MGNNLFAYLYRVYNENKVLFLLSAVAITVGLTVSAPPALTGGLITIGVYGLRISHQISNPTSSELEANSIENPTPIDLEPLPTVDPVEALLSRPVIQQTRRPRSQRSPVLSKDRSMFIQQILDIAANPDSESTVTETELNDNHNNNIESELEELLNPQAAASRLLFQHTNYTNTSAPVRERGRVVPESVEGCSFLKCSIM